jgi:hypothetical protein
MFGSFTSEVIISAVNRLYCTKKGGCHDDDTSFQEEEGCYDDYSLPEERVCPNGTGLPEEAGCHETPAYQKREVVMMTTPYQKREVVMKHQITKRGRLS